MKWGCAPLRAVGRAAGRPGEEAGLDPKEGLYHIMPEMSLGWSSWMLSPSLGLGSCASRLDVSPRPRSLPQPTSGGTSSPCGCQMPRLTPTARAGI